MTYKIAPMTERTIEKSFVINQAYQLLLSPMEKGEFEALVESAWYARQCFDGAAFLIAFDQDATYGGENFAWFKKRYDRFAYVDRIAVAEDLQGKGIARVFYDDVINLARGNGAQFLCAEVNIEPPNPASHSFHKSFGFAPLDTAMMGAKTIQYYAKPLT